MIAYIEFDNRKCFEWMQGKHDRNYSGEGRYVLVTENKKELLYHVCSSRNWANKDLLESKVLDDNNIDEVYSNKELIWKRNILNSKPSVYITENKVKLKE